MPHCKDFRVPWGDLAVGENIPRHQSQVPAHQQGGFALSSPLPAPQSLRIPPPVWGKGRSSSSCSVSLYPVPVWAGLEFMAIPALSWEPGLAWLPSPSGRAASGFGRGSSSHTHSSCSLQEILGCWSQQNSQQCFPRALALPGREGKWCQAAGRSRLGLSSWEEAFPPLCSLPELCEGAAAWQEPPPATATIRDTLPRLWGVPRQPHAGPGLLHALGESCFISSAVPGIPPALGMGAAGKVSLGIARGKRELHLFPPC